MKTFKTLIAIPFLFLLLFACGSETKAAEDKTGKEYTSAYICPMHCEGSGSDKAGKCSTCKMDYVCLLYTSPSPRD